MSLGGVAIPARLQSGIRARLSLAFMLARRDLRNRYAASYAGIAWNVGVPLLYSLINVIVFSVLMKGRMGERYGDVPFALFYFVPFTLWAGFSEVATRSPGILREYGYLINKISFPASVLPLIPFASALLSQAILLAIVAVLMIWLDVAPAVTAWWFLPLWALSLLITLGFAYAVASISVFIPDLVQVVPVLVNILFWLTPILYPATIVADSDIGWLRLLVMDLNPFYYVAESARLAVLGGVAVPWSNLLVLVGSAGASVVAGLWIFRKLRPGFADVI